MKALLYKDLIALKKALILMLVILALIAFYFYKEGQIYLLPLFFILLPVIILGMLFGTDSQDRLDHYLVPSPVKRSTIVLSRYVIVWFMSTLAVILTLVMPWLTQENPLALDWFLLIPGIFLMTSFISAVQLPLMYRFGETKARLIFVGLYFVTFAFFSSIASNKEWLVAKLQAGFSLDSRYLALILTAVAILVNGISYLCSRGIYEKREF
ncbi:MAG: ABC-2 transporter permease [Eubacteriales bacterium]|nr:ABC-2 transporter permease [Eubacteriales bacterium]